MSAVDLDALVERLTKLANDMSNHATDECDEHEDVEAAIAAITALRRAPVSADLSDPVAVHANMLRGTIAKPTPEQIKHLYPDLFAPVSAGKVNHSLEKGAES